MNPYNAIDLSKVPVPDAIKGIDPNEIREYIINTAVNGMRLYEPDFYYPLVSDPGYQYANAAALRHVYYEQRVNEAVRSVMLATAENKDLDALAAFYKVERLLVDEGNPDAVPPIDPVYESDSALRLRCTLSPEGFTTAGSFGSYVFHAMSASGLVKSAFAMSPVPCEMNIYILANNDTGVPDQSLLDHVYGYLDGKRPDGDLVRVLPVEIVEYQIEATINFFSGASPQLIIDLCHQAISAWVAENEKFGRDVVRSAIDRQLHQEGVYRVDIHEPQALPIEISESQVAKCTSIKLNIGTVKG